MKDLYLRPFNPGDEKVLDAAKESFTAGSLETPHGYMDLNVETAVCEKGDEGIVSSLTGTLSVTLDPLIRVEGFSPEQYLAALFKLEAILTYRAQQFGAVDAYIAIPEGVTDEERAAAYGYERIVRRCGYEQTVQNCKIFRRTLTRPAPDESAKLALVDEVEAVPDAT